MKTLFIHNYIEALSDANNRFTKVVGCRMFYDSKGTPEFRSRKGRVGFKVEVGGEIYAVICPTTEDIQVEDATFTDELYVFNDRDEGAYYTVFFKKLCVPGSIRNRCQEYDWRSNQSEGLISVSSNGLYGYVDKDGNLVIPCEYDWADDFCEGVAVVRKGRYFGCIKRDGKVVIPFEYDEASWDGEIGLLGVEKEGRYGFLNREGRIVVPLKYDWRGEFSDGLAMMKRGGYYCYVDCNGAEVIPPLYEDAGTFRCGVAEVVCNGDVYYINTKGERVNKDKK